ncbi:MAG: Tex family protein [Eubacteriales bacterium]|nr:Tex family protein [Eubacteriales bacterium]MDY3332509.1 Tex family protein [Gallibacter sp.]
MDIIKKLAEELNIREKIVEATVELIDDGNTIPFIARYRKEVTGGLDDEILRTFNERLEYLRNLEKRKEEVIRLLEEQDKLTDELRDEILKAEVLQRIEDLYKPFKKKKATRASKAREKGLLPLAELIFAQELESGDVLELAGEYINEELGVTSAQEALQGAMDIIAEMISDDAKIVDLVREIVWATGVIETEAVDSEAKSPYEMYYSAKEKAGVIPNHRILAINRGEKEKFLKVKLVVDDERVISDIEKQVIANEKTIFVDVLKQIIADANKRLIMPSVEREVRSTLTERAEKDAIQVFARNTEKLLMVPPVKNARILAIDPGYRTGCKVAVLDERGKLLAYTTIYPTKPKEDIVGTVKIFDKLIGRFELNTVVIGNGTASRETEEVVANYIKDKNLDLRYTIVNEAGASVYSASAIATEEYPDLDVTTRGAMSLGRRLQDPLAELVKIPTKSIGVGQYQHDINQKELENSLHDVVEYCVNEVGVNLNTASRSLLSYVAGINSTIAKNIVAYREENGAFKNRKELKKVAKLGDKAFEQCAGFLRIAEGSEFLDKTGVHPESYTAAKKVLDKLGLKDSDFNVGGVADIEDRIITLYPMKSKSVEHKNMKGLGALKNITPPKRDKKAELKYAIKQLADELEIGEFTLVDIISEIKKPGRDPREDAPQVIFRNDVKDFADLKVGMELDGTVRNVVDFGAFVDIGVKNDGLVHISQMSDKYIKHPMDVVSVGDNVKVRIIEIDEGRQKVGLTMKIKD